MANQSNMIIKSISVLRAFTDIQHEWGVNELARYLEVPVSSLHRILKSLRDEGLLMIQSQSNKYTFGPEFIRMSAIVQSKSNIYTLTKPILQQTSKQLDETIYIALYSSQHQKLSYIDVALGSRKLQYMLELGVHYPIHIAASGKAILSSLPPATIIQILDSVDINGAEREHYIQLLHTYKEQGYAESIGERQSDSYGISAPFFNAAGEVLGSVTCSIPVPFFEQKRKQEYVNEIKYAASIISQQLGYSIKK